jgi:predicted N-acetyltransferase YhbS
MQVRPIQGPDIPAVAKLLAQAFDDDPAYGVLFPEPDTRIAGLAHFFRANLGLHLAHACTHVAVADGGELLGTVTLRPVAGLAISTVTMLRHGLLPFAIAHGIGTVRRLFWVKQAYEKLEEEASARAEHLYVHMMAVNRDRQGQGIGKFLLSQVLEDARKLSPSACTVLSTHTELCVKFYRSQGFETVSEEVLTPSRGAPYKVWSMRSSLA